MEAIARAAGVSKATIYAYFPSKEALFASLIVEECRRAHAIVTMPDLSRGIAEALRSFSKQYIRLFVDRGPNQIAFFHVLVPEVSRFPELAQLLLDSGPKAHAERLAQLLRDACERGLLDIADPLVAASQFLSLIRGDLPIEAALGLPAPADAEVDKTIEDGVSLFLRAYPQKS